jgi:glycerol-3-phosphate dehydrogenase
MPNTRETDIFDLAVIGGGINGVGIARDATGRGLSVYLCEQNDLASGTSSWSTKLIHGGLRYLEHYKFRLVRESLLEREKLWKIAPHIIWPLRFVLPHHAGLRPAWFLRLGLFLYDHMGGRKKLPPTSVLDLTSDPAGAPLVPEFRRGFEYSDCWVQDARLVVLNAMDARDRGAVVETRTKLVSARRADGVWELELQHADGTHTKRRAKRLVNAAGPWVASVLSGAIRLNAAAGIRLVQGSHIVVRKLFAHDRAYIFQNADGRIIFAIPYEQDFTLIGTTDQDYEGDPAKVAASEAEITYLIAAASEYFRQPIERSNVVWTYSGVRPLYDDGASKAQEATRDYVLVADTPDGEAPLLSVYGGKITTYRRLAMAVLDKLGIGAGPKGSDWTAEEVLPGGDFTMDGAQKLAFELRRNHPFLSETEAAHLVRHYGTRARMILGTAKTRAQLGRNFGHGLSGAEVRYLMREEWAVTAEDVLWRRSKLGLRLDKSQVAALAAFMRAETKASRP